jgi:hypothetical protein
MKRPRFQIPVTAITLAWLFVAGAYGQKSGTVDDGIKLALPFQSWGVRIDNPGAIIEKREMKSGRQAYLLASHPKNGIVISITIEIVSQPADVMEFLLDQNEFAALRQKNFFACLTRADAFIDIHMAKGNFVPADQTVMEQVLATLQFVDADLLMAPAIESSTELMAQGSRWFLARDYKSAIPPYEHALEIEELKRRLSPDMWRVLVDNLGMSFAFTGNLESAEGVFRFGISKDPTYAMFHYNLACTRAEKNDMAGAIEELKVAFRNRNTVLKGESMPNPAKDDSFASFMSNTEFTRFLNELR